MELSALSRVALASHLSPHPPPTLLSPQHTVLFSPSLLLRDNLVKLQQNRPDLT